MTVNQARKILNKKLIFGNIQQIEALNILRLVNQLTELKEQYPNIDYVCNECDGVGFSEDNENCEWCDGSGNIEITYLENLNYYELENQIEFILYQIR